MRFSAAIHYNTSCSVAISALKDVPMSQLFIILSITILCARAFSITVLCARACHGSMEQERIVSVRNDSVPQRKDHEEPGPAKLRRHARICEEMAARCRRTADELDAGPKDDTTSEAHTHTQSEDSKESDEGEKESGDSETIQPGEKKECLEPSIVKAAWVYSQSAHAHQVLPVDVGEAPDSSWYPCLVAYNTSDPGCQNVLCKPLLENGCKRPFRTHESRLVHINSHAPHPQNFDHSEEVIEPQPEHFERSTVETMLGGNIDGDDGKPALTGAALGIRKEDVRDRERKEALKLAKKAVRDILVWRCTSNALGLRNYMSCRIDCMRGHGIVDPPSCH